MDPSTHAACYDDHHHFRVSSHLLVDRQGQVTQFVALKDRAWHCGSSSFQGRTNCNDFAIGIELEGTDEHDFTPEQYQSLIQLTFDIQAIYPDISDDHIVGHSDIAPGRKFDPGPRFDWSYYKKSLKLKRL